MISKSIESRRDGVDCRACAQAWNSKHMIQLAIEPESDSGQYTDLTGS